MTGEPAGRRQAHRVARHLDAVRRHLRLPVVRRRGGGQRRHQRTFTPRAAQLGKRLRVKVTASLADATSASTTSSRHRAVAPGVLTATAPPVVSGYAPGRRPGLRHLEHLVPAARPAYQWRAPAARSPGPPVRLHPDGRAGRSPLTVGVTATRAGYTTATSTSAATAAVQPGAFAPQPAHGHGHRPGRPAADRVAGRVVAQRGSAYQWLVDGAPVAGATGPSYTPAAADLRKQVAVQVTVTLPGLHPRHGHVRGHRRGRPGNVPQHQRSLGLGDAAGRRAPEAAAGWRSPEPDARYQWSADGAPIAGRHLEHRSRPRPPRSARPCRSR